MSLGLRREPGVSVNVDKFDRLGFGRIRRKGQGREPVVLFLTTGVKGRERDGGLSRFHEGFTGTHHTKKEGFLDTCFI